MNRISLAEGKRVLYNKNVPEKEFFLEHYLDEKERMIDELGQKSSEVWDFFVASFMISTAVTWKNKFLPALFLG